MSERIQFKDSGEHWTIRLYKTSGTRKTGAKTKSRGFKQTCLVLYFDVEHDWGSQHLKRNGNEYGYLCSAPATPEAREYKSYQTRACSLRYSGLGKQNAQGLAEDLRFLGYDEKTIESFLEAAKPHWPLEISLKSEAVNVT